MWHIALQQKTTKQKSHSKWRTNSQRLDWERCVERLACVEKNTNKKNQHKLQWAINRNMQRFVWGGRSCSTPLPLDGWKSSSRPTLLLCNTRALWDPRESVWWLVRLSETFNERDSHTNSLFPFSHLGYMWSLSKVVPQHNVFQIGLQERRAVVK